MPQTSKGCSSAVWEPILQNWRDDAVTGFCFLSRFRSANTDQTRPALRREHKIADADFPATRNSVRAILQVMLGRYRLTRADKAAEYFDGEPRAPTNFEPDPGTYALIMSSARDDLIGVGQLGDLCLQPGFYVYVGSALGSGGVRARLAHHSRPAFHPIWHIDYLRLHTTLEEVWFIYDPKSHEHDWARRFAGMTGASVPLAGFGSSDCDCESHLYFFKMIPSREALIEIRKSELREVRRDTSADHEQPVED